MSGLMGKLLIVEDDPAVIKSIAGFLTGEGFAVDCADGQRAAEEKLTANTYDLILLDISLSDGNGFAVCSYVKSLSDTPVIFLTAADAEYSVVAGLDMGADDYIVKPVRPRELTSRIRSVLRRTGRGRSVIRWQGIAVDTDKAVVTKNGEELFLSALEYRLLLIFFTHLGQILTREQLLNDIWDAAGEYVNDNTLTVYIKRLRNKIEDDPSEPTIIRTVRGFGYKAGE